MYFDPLIDFGGKIGDWISRKIGLGGADDWTVEAEQRRSEIRKSLGQIVAVVPKAKIADAREQVYMFVTQFIQDVKKITVNTLETDTEIELWYNVYDLKLSGLPMKAFLKNLKATGATSVRARDASDRITSGLPLLTAIFSQKVSGFTSKIFHETFIGNTPVIEPGYLLKGGNMMFLALAGLAAFGFLQSKKR